MGSILHLTLLLATVGLGSCATFQSSSASAGGPGGGGTAFTTSTRFNNRPASTTSFTTGTGQTFNSGGSFNSGVGNRGSFRPFQVPRVPSFNFNFRPIAFPRVPQFRPQTQFFGNNGVGSRFGGNRFGSGTSGFSTAGSNGFNSIDANGFFNRLSNQINRSFAANLNG
ncbi:nucleoporin NUP145-like [Amphibalanus amphitrite]|nr:nucleoporin NUP145-like [Amphibalanus amphitrite]XP_043201908.1 nucleoporin NUP145-like [Amphibalanus amphitrite]XP_043205027.1 nucleoporin NUP145-like [Amphibalanus amphitrite]XP_043205028.1 nucleoporin NUP145-like [Amphibalanus amphitrite]